MSPETLSLADIPALLDDLRREQHSDRHGRLARAPGR
jgi:hypothetical protein